MFQAALLHWYDRHKRSLPWRANVGEASDFYRVWLSEVMLQQTTVKAVIPYYQRFLARWPDVRALASACLDEVLIEWAGLGYYARARNLHRCARILARGGSPSTAAALKGLPGFGRYTSAAVAAIVFGEAATVVDGNVERVISRLFAVETALPAAKQQLIQLAATLTPSSRAGDYAQAMMDLGATLCTPRAPSCLLCPVAAFCGVLGRNPERYPVRGVKANRPARRGSAYVIEATIEGKRHVLLRRRPESGLLGGMMEVPSSEWVANGAEIPALSWTHPAANLSAAAWLNGGLIRHTFTHFHLELQVLAARMNDPGEVAAVFGGEWVPTVDTSNRALPTVMKKALLAGLSVLDRGG